MRDKYLDLDRDLRLQYVKDEVDSDVIETILKRFVTGLEGLEIRGQAVTIQTTLLLRLARILWEYLESLGNLLSLRLKLNTIN